MTKYLGTLLVGLLALPVAAAPDDEELAPLTPVRPRPKAVPPRKAAPTTKAPSRAVPVRAAPAKRAGPARPARVVEEELAPLVPVVARGQLLVRTAGGVSGAALSLDGKAQGTIPLGPLSVPAGEHWVTVTRPGFAVFTRNVSVSPGKTLEVEAKLTPTAAVLSVKTDVPGAEVRVDGWSAGVTPLEGVEVPPGTVEVVVTRSGFRPVRQTFAATAGVDYPLSVVLEPAGSGGDAPLATSLLPSQLSAPALEVGQRPVQASGPITQKWYFWVGVGVAVAGIALATTAAVTAALPPRTRAPNDVCRVPCDGVMP